MKVLRGLQIVVAGAGTSKVIHFLYQDKFNFCSISYNFIIPTRSSGV